MAAHVVVSWRLAHQLHTLTQLPPSSSSSSSSSQEGAGRATGPQEQQQQQQGDPRQAPAGPLLVWSAPQQTPW
jgi:hypothetical protein